MVSAAESTWYTNVCEESAGAVMGYFVAKLPKTKLQTCLVIKGVILNQVLVCLIG